MAVLVDAAAEAVIEAFGEYQRHQRRLSELTIAHHGFGVRQFLAWRVATGRPGLEEMDPGELIDFVIHEAGRLHGGSIRATVSVLRNFVRFLFAAGLISADLSGAIPSVAGARFSGLPRAVAPTVVEALLASCDRTSPVGRRDFAILVLMSRLGLRAADIAGMRLDDIDWAAGELAVRGKGGRRDRLPLPQDVGEAVVDYLRFGRPPSTDRAVFLRARPPAVGMTIYAAVQVSRSASARAGLAEVVGAHRLRHTAATQMLRRGASLAEVGQVLRHNDDTVTAVYAKVDRSSLWTVVRPWPGEATR